MDQLTSSNGPWPKAIDAVTLFVEDMEIAKEFYQRTFGLSVFFEDDDSAVFKFGSVLINLLKSTAAVELVEPAMVGRHDGSARLVFTIAVDDVDAMCSELAARGVTLLNGPMDRPWGPRTASFADPDGFIWEIAS